MKSKLKELYKKLKYNHSQMIVKTEGKYTEKETLHNQALELESQKIEAAIERLEKINKKPTYKELAEYLGVIEQTVKQYPKLKRDLMVQGLWRMKERSKD
jgi:predicted transcriptional regulator